MTDGRDGVLGTMDRCTKCGICQSYCPVSAATTLFPGPKYTGPQAQRFRVIEPTADISPALCSGCGVCTSVCPNGVAIADIITIAKAAMAGGGKNLPIRQRLLNRPDMIGLLGGRTPALTNGILANRFLRGLAERLIGIHRKAPLPKVSGPVFRRWLNAHGQPDGPMVTYYSGCAVENYDPHVGIALVRVMNRLGFHVEAPSEACCSLPMLSSGEWEAASSRADKLIDELSPAAEAGRPIISTSISCGLAIRAKYATYLNRLDDKSKRVAGAVVDVCEFLRDGHDEELASFLTPLPLRILYHGPCQLRGHRMGMPAVELLRLIPELSSELSQADCCGVSGTYGYDAEKYDIANAVGRTLFDQVAETGPDLIVCDSETCRWNIEQETGVPCRHPIEVLAAAIFGEDPAHREPLP